MSFNFASPPATAAPAAPLPPPASTVALPVPDYDSIFHGKRWREISSLADAVWKKEQKSKKKKHGSTNSSNHRSSSNADSTSSSSSSSLSWEAQELQANLRRHQELWITEACSSASNMSSGSSGSSGNPLFASNVPSSPPWQVQPHERQHYLDRPEMFPEIEIAASKDPSTSASSQPQQPPQPPRRARLNRTLIEQMFQLCHELHIGEGVALALLLRVTQQQQQSSSFSASVLSASAQAIVAACRQLWFHEKCLALSTLLRIVQYRLECREIVAATDAILSSDLVPKLLASISEHSKCARELRTKYHEEREAAQAMMDHSQLSGAPGTTTPNWTVLEWHIQYHAAQRQSACQTLFYVAYRTQLNAVEVAQLVDAIHELSQSLDVLDPVDDVPSPYVDVETHPAPPQQVGASMWNYPFPHSTVPSSATTKDELQWRRELIDSVHESSLPDLLRAVSTLVMATLCALDARSVLTDRTTHADNAFGVGNALLPPNASAADQQQLLAPIHARLSRDAAERWNRPDILGVLLAAYSLLLRSSTGVNVASPSHATAATTTTTTTPDLRKAWRECLEAPAELKSFTFARMGLVPAVLSAGSDPSEHDILGKSQRPRNDRSSVCDTTEFLVSVLARFASTYLSVLSEYGDLPISRVKWEQDAEASLRLRRSHQEQQRQFQAWSGTNDVVDGTAEVIPAAVDMAQRPDCMDDVMAFVAAVAALGPHSAAVFWSKDEPPQPPATNGSNQVDAPRLAPSLALSALDRQQEDDESLLPCFLTFLSSLAHAEGGAAAVHQMLSAPVEDGRKGQVTWGSIFGILRWYTQQLAKDDFGGSPGIKSAATLHTSTSYYYADDEATDAGTDSTWARNGTESVSKPRDLTEASSFVLMSHLCLVSSVCWGCPAARAALLGSEATIQGAAIDQDSTLVVLFSLAVAPLPSDLRGAVFTALASILTAHPSDAAFAKIQASASTAWQILDQCQVLPIYLLDQYPSSFEKNSKNYVGLRFPPASVALVVDKPGRSWIPPDSMYSIIYELEYIESSKGVYHSTEGFLRLLRALFGTAGCSQDLGGGWRARTGCTPYIEYVTRFVLPRATGLFQGSTALQFRTPQDKDRLVALSLEVVIETVSKYLVLTPSNNFREVLQPVDVPESYRQLFDSSLEELGMISLVSDIVAEPSIQDATQFMLDWVPSHTHKISNFAGSDAQALSGNFEDQNTPLSSRRTLGNSSPRPKSAALSVFVDLLHESGGALLKSIVRVLVESTMQHAPDVDSDRASLAFALFNATPPSLAGSKHATSHPPPASLECSISPLQEDRERLCSGNATDWGERATLAALNALCSALVRESALIHATNSSPGTGSIVPVLSFRSPGQGVSHPEVLSLKLTRLSQLLMSLNSDSGILCNIMNLVGCIALDEVRDAAIGQASTSIILCMNDALAATSLARFYPNAEGGEAELARAFGTRLSVSGGRLESAGDVDILRVVLNHLLCGLRKNELASESTWYALLGFQSRATVSWTEPSSHEANCFNALLYILNDDDFSLSPFTAELGPMTFEVFARLMTVKASEDAQDLARIQHAAGLLRSIDFWRFHLSKILSHFGLAAPVPYDYLMHSSAWLLKSLANEVDFLRGDVVGNPQLVQLERLVSDLCAPPSDVLSHFVRLLPLQRPEFDVMAIKPPDEALAWAKAKMTGSPEVVEGFDVIRFDRFRSFEGLRGKPNVDEMEAWCQFWNALVARDCSTSHLSSALYLILGSMLVSESGHVARVPAIQRGLNGLLIDVLGRLSIPNLDSSCYSTATRNLALAALLVTRESLFCSNASGTAESSFDGALIRSMAAASVVSSSNHLGLGNAGSLRQERTALLGTVLSLLLQNTSSFDMESTASQFVDAATCLAALSLDVTTSGSLATPTNAAAIARDCLSVMFDKLRDSAPASGQPTFARSVLFHPFNGENFATCCMRLVRKLDSNLTRLLVSISSSPLGCQLLLDSGILEALVDASERYKVEESMAISTKAGNVELEVPAFFLGHVQLLVALLMNAVDVDQDYVLSKCARFLLNYELVLERIASQFPRSMPFVQQISRLNLAVKHVSRRPSKVQLMPLALEYKWLALAFKLACFPLPDTFLSALPEPLRGPATGRTNVAFSSDVDVSWWNLVDADPGVQLLDARQRALHMCSYATDGADVVKAFLWSFLRKPSSTASFDSRLISSCLCRCCDALQVIELPIMNRVSELGEPGVFESTDGLKLRSLLWDIVFELLVLLLERVRLYRSWPRDAISQPTDLPRESIDDAKFMIRVALDHCRFDLTSAFSPAVAKQLDLVAELARALRRELERP